jgi:hypothetical protein
MDTILQSFEAPVNTPLPDRESVGDYFLSYVEHFGYLVLPPKHMGYPLHTVLVVRNTRDEAVVWALTRSLTGEQLPAINCFFGG